MAIPSPTQKVQIALLEREVTELKLEVAELNTSVKELVDAWKAATGLLKFIRIIGMCAGGITAILAFVHSTKGMH